MTPDEARRLLDGTTPGPWRLQQVKGHPHLRHITTWTGHSGDPTAPVCIPVDVTSREGAANMALIVAAPDMARTIAGMREEWGVSWDDDPSDSSRDWGFSTRAAAERWEKANRRYGPGRGHVVRRYVTEPEEA